MFVDIRLPPQPQHVLQSAFAPFHKNNLIKTSSTRRSPLSRPFTKLGRRFTAPFTVIVRDVFLNVSAKRSRV